MRLHRCSHPKSLILEKFTSKSGKPARFYQRVQLWTIFADTEEYTPEPEQKDYRNAGLIWMKTQSEPRLYSSLKGEVP